MRVRVPPFPTVAPRNLEGVLSTYPLTTRQTIDGLREQASVINEASDALYWGAGQNEIVNGNFFINQRRSTSLGSGTGIRRMADAWSIQSVGTTYTASIQNFTFGQTAVPNEPRFYNRVTTSTVAGAGNYCKLYTALQGRSTDYAQRRVTITWWAKADAAKPIGVELWRKYGTGGGPSSDDSVGGVKVQISTVWAKYQLFFDVPALTGKTLGTDENEVTGISFWFDAGSTFSSQSGGIGQQSGTFDIADVVVCIGNLETVRRRTHAQELALCQRLFFRGGGGPEAAQNFGVGFAYNGDAAYLSYFLPVPMRDIPTLTVNNLANFALDHQGAFIVALTGLTMSNPPSRNNTALYLRATIATALTTGVATLYANASTAATLDFSAEV